MARTTPAPAGPFQDVRADVRTNERVNDKRSRHKAADEATPLQGGDVGDDNRREELETCVSSAKVLAKIIECGSATTYTA